jgi:hypothetical protein
MTISQESHLVRIKAEFTTLVDAKYRQGAAEHSGKQEGELLQLPALKILDHAIDETIDLVAYLLSLKEKLTKELTA